MTLRMCVPTTLYLYVSNYESTSVVVIASEKNYVRTRSNNIKFCQILPVTRQHRCVSFRIDILA